MATLTCSRSVKYRNPSKIKVENFVFVKLSLPTYKIWKKLMQEFLESEGMIGFVNGSIEAPPERITEVDGKERDNQDYEEWKRSDALVRKWILSTVSDDVLEHVVRFDTAEGVWFTINHALDQPDGLPVEIELDFKGKIFSQYVPLYKAVLNGDWETARRFIEKEPEAVRAIITGASETALMVAVRSTKRRKFLMKLLEMMLPEDLAIKDRFGYTALHMAAQLGNIDAAKLMVDKYADLPNVGEGRDFLPIHLAAGHGRRNMVSYLMTVTKDDAEHKPFEDDSGVHLIRSLLFGGLYDIAVSLLQKNPKLAGGNPSPMIQLVVNRSVAFPSNSRFATWQRLLYSYAPVELKNIADIRAGGTAKNSSNAMDFVTKRLCAALWWITEILVPQAKLIYNKKLMHQQALYLVKSICQETLKMDRMNTVAVLGLVQEMATNLGVPEVVEEIVASLPGASLFRAENTKETWFQQAIMSRNELVYNLIYQHEESAHMLLTLPDINMNNALHAAGCLNDKQRVGLRANAAGPALQMQRELQWFKEVEKFMEPQDREQKNVENKTPLMVFIETHEELMKEGEEWMKDKANSCTFVATLIATAAFASAITVPGGNQDSGLPTFSRETAFTTFAISDALAFFSSVSSIIMFLSILTSRYAADDFLYALPKKLIIGLMTLFVAIITLMVSFSTAAFLVFGDKRAWTLIPLVILSVFCTTSFAFLQFPSLFGMIKSTYFPHLFGRRSHRVLY